MRLLAPLFLLLFSACGYSPLLNHENEKSLGALTLQNSEADGYRFKNSGFGLYFTWDIGPQMGSNTLSLKIWDPNLGTISGPFQDPPSELAVDLWMPDMGHGSRPVIITKTNPGEYTITKVYFIMHGNWQVRFRLKREGQIVDEVAVNLSL